MLRVLIADLGMNRTHTLLSIVVAPKSERVMDSDLFQQRWIVRSVNPIGPGKIFGMNNMKNGLLVVSAVEPYWTNQNMPRLKDRNKQTPGGHKFYDAILKYRARPWASVEEIAAGLVAARKANPALTQQHGWSTDEVTVRNEVDESIALHCQQMGWHNFIADTPIGGAPINFQQPQKLLNQRFLGRVRNVAVGKSIIVDFIKSKEEAVPISHAQARADICVTCEFNEKPSSWLDIFTTTVSEGIRQGLERLRGWNLPVPNDDKLGYCTRCTCPLALKVYFPITFIKSKMPKDVEESLPDYCWIKKELQSIEPLG